MHGWCRSRKPTHIINTVDCIVPVLLCTVGRVVPQQNEWIDGTVWALQRFCMMIPIVLGQSFHFLIALLPLPWTTTVASSNWQFPMHQVTSLVTSHLCFVSWIPTRVKIWSSYRKPMDRRDLYPTLNIPGNDEDVSSDTFYGPVPAIDNKFTMAQNLCRTLHPRHWRAWHKNWKAICQHPLRQYLWMGSDVQIASSNLYNNERASKDFES